MKPCHVLSMFLTFWHLKPYVLIWFVLIKKLCMSWHTFVQEYLTNNLTGVTPSGIVFFNQLPFKQTASDNWLNPLKNARKAMIWVISSRNTERR